MNLNLINTQEKMKIISNFKDYYDYVAGERGVDERIVFDRRPEQLITTHREKRPQWEPCSMYVPTFNTLTRQYGSVYHVHLCGTRYCITYVNEEFCFTISDLQRNVPPGHIYRHYYGFTDPQPTDLNTIHDRAAILKDPWALRSGFRLSDFGFKKLFSPEEMWDKLYNFHVREPELVQLDNKSKIIKAGFDLKTSFRGKQ